MALRARNPSPRGLATLNLQSTCCGPRPGSKLAHGVRAGSLRATEPSTRKDPRSEEKKCRSAKKTHLYIVIYIGGRLVIPGIFTQDLDAIATTTDDRHPRWTRFHSYNPTRESSQPWLWMLFTSPNCIRPVTPQSIGHVLVEDLDIARRR